VFALGLFPGADERENMKSILFIILFYGISAQAANRECEKSIQKNEDEILFEEDLAWDQSLNQMGDNYKKIYSSTKRLYKHAYFDKEKGKYYLPNQYPENSVAEVPAAFIKNITAHVEEALLHKFADYIFFSDMGHSHFYVPLKDWDKLKDLSPLESAKLYEGFFRSSGLRIMYHTAEQLKIKEGPRENASLPRDQFLLWRYFTRNLFGRNNGSRDLVTFFAWDNDNYNTYRADLEGYYYYSAGFNISANKNGCFPFKKPDGTIEYFDLSLFDLPSGRAVSATSF
jgi:hypothetical protein